MKKKIKYQGGITRLICKKIALSQKEKFKKKIINTNSRFFEYSNSNRVDFDIISYSGSAAFEDQLLSLYSFVYYGGIPKSWVIYSDGSYTEEQIKIFKREFDFVEVLNWYHEGKFLDNKLILEWSKKFNFHKKLIAIIAHPLKRQTFYLDSDIIFYKNIKHYLEHTALQKGLWYVPDTFGDMSKFFNGTTDYMYALNSGLLIFNKDFETEDLFIFLESLKGNYIYFTDQLAIEYAFRRQRADILDPRQFIIDSSDQFDFSTKYHPSEIAMRHYTTPVRHKMWQNGWEWHFKA